MQKLPEWLVYIIHIPRRCALGMIFVYQKTISPDHGVLRGLHPHGFCKFYPSCSEYTRLAILHEGVIRGGLKGAWRILRCNPWSEGGIDYPMHVDQDTTMKSS